MACVATDDAHVLRSLRRAAETIAAEAAARPSGGPAYLVGVSGIDGSGKSYLSCELARAIEGQGLRVAPIGIDLWQNPQPIRFGGPDRGRHFYEHALRFDALFAELVDPLVERRSIRLATRGIRTDRDVWDDVIYDFTDVDVVLVEGILLFQRALVDRYDLRIWIDCSFDMAVRRALARNVEALPPEQLLADYEHVYHAAQRYHFAVDAPQASADIVLLNE